MPFAAVALRRSFGSEARELSRQFPPRNRRDQPLYPRRRRRLELNLALSGALAADVFSSETLAMGSFRSPSCRSAIIERPSAALQHIDWIGLPQTRNTRD